MGGFSRGSVPDEASSKLEKRNGRSRVGKENRVFRRGEKKKLRKSKKFHLGGRNTTAWIANE